LIHVLDACAMLAYLRAEQGGSVVAGLLSDPTANCCAHTINLIEVYYDFVRRSNVRDARKALSVLRIDGVSERRLMNQRFARRVGDLKARGGISLADCFCIALAQELGAEVVTSDHHEFDALVPLALATIRFIR
jgi:PIN domain nuclease of toxin-antitoxin system